MSSIKALILYYSGSGNTQKMAKAIAKAMKSSAINVTVKDIGKLDIFSLPKYDSIVLGSPTYFSNIAWQVKKVIDESIVHYRGGRLKGKVAGIITSAGTGRDGKDCLKMLEVALGFHHGRNVVEGGR
jgi:NAD(P)H dehydrogenase (quinone)